MHRDFVRITPIIHAELSSDASGGRCGGSRGRVSTVSRVPTAAVPPRCGPRRGNGSRRRDAASLPANAIARGLKLASAGALRLLCPRLRTRSTRRHPGRVRPRLGARLRRAARRGPRRAERPAAYERLVEEGRIDGLLIASARPGSPLFDHLASDPIPCVFVNRRHRGRGRNAVITRRTRAGWRRFTKTQGMGSDARWSTAGSGTGAGDQGPVDAALLDEPLVRLLGTRRAEVSASGAERSCAPRRGGARPRMMAE